MFVWIAVGGFVALLVLLDLTDYLLARAGKHSLLHRRRPIQDRLTDARDAVAEGTPAQTYSPADSDSLQRRRDLSCTAWVQSSAS